MTKKTLIEVLCMLPDCYAYLMTLVLPFVLLVWQAVHESARVREIRESHEEER